VPLSVDAQAGELESQRPGLKNAGESSIQFSQTPSSDVGAPTVTVVNMPLPNATAPIPSATPFPAVSSPVVTPTMEDVCPYYHDDPIASNPALEEEGYVGHEDEEGDGES
jgi:hypothetical protein